jgi:signal transduction histidine kinase
MLMRIKDISIRWKILLFSAGSFLIIVALLSYFGISAAQASTNQTLNERLVLAEQVAYGVDYNIQQAFRQLESMSESDLVGANSSATSLQFLAEMKRILPFNIQYISIIDNNRKVIATEPNIPQLIGSEISADLITGDSVSFQNPYVSNCLYDNYVHDYVAYIIAPLAKEDPTAPQMTILAAIKLSSNAIGQLINVTGPEKTGYLEIVDGNGIVLATSHSENLLKMSDHGGMFTKLIQQHQTIVGTCHSCHTPSENANVTNEIITFAPLSVTSWGVIIRQSEQEALANTRSLQQRLIIFSAIALAIMLLAAWFISKNITGSLNRLTLASRKIAAGSLDEPVIIHGKDEIGVLASSFDTMREKLKDSIERIRQRTTELEGLNAIALTSTQSLDLDTILSGALGRVMELTKMQAGAILLLDAKSQGLVFRINKGFPDEYVRNTGSGNNHESVEEKAARTGEPQFLNRSELVSSVPLLSDEGMAALVCFPLRSKDKIVGILTMAGWHPREFTASDKQLLFSIANQISMAIENAKLYAELRDKEGILAELLKRSISVQEEERKRIARELHDETSQALTSLAIGLETIVKSPPADVEQLKTALKKDQVLISRILDDVHRLILDLRPSVLDDLGLIPALEWYAENRLGNNGVKVHLETSGTERRLPPHVEVTLFRIAQEAISNIAQHAGAEFVSITLDFDSDAIKLTVEDDGRGFDSTAVLSGKYDKRGLGLLGMMERAEALGGNFTIKSQPRKGTQISIKIPVNW